MKDKPGIVKIVFALALIGAAVAITVRSCNASRVSEMAMTMPCACTSCDWSGDMELEERPAKCPECKETTVWPALLCTKCGNHQPVDLLKFNAEGSEPYCTECKHRGLTEIE